MAAKLFQFLRLLAAILNLLAAILTFFCRKILEGLFKSSFVSASIQVAIQPEAY